MQVLHGRAVIAVSAVAVLVTACSGGSSPDHGASTAPASSSVTSSTPAPRTSTAPSTSAPATSPPAALVYKSGTALPDPKATPGASLSGVTTAQVCERTWNADHKTIGYRVQNEVSARYGVIAGQGTSIHLDQLVPASLGGAATAANVWPQPEGTDSKPGYKQKNILETHMHMLVCRGQVSLSTAQQAIAADWLSAMHTYLSIPVATIH